MPTQPTSPAIDPDVALRRILEGTAAETGEQFFNALVENLARALNTKGAWVTEFIEESRRLRMLAYWEDGRFVEDYEYDIVGTPCEQVIDSCSLKLYSENLIALFPEDPALEPFGAVSYLGVPLLDVAGKILGHLAVQDDRPMPEEPEKLAVIRIFGGRAAAELQRLRAESEVREREEELSRLVDSAMDAIIQLDRNFIVIRANPAATKVFKCVTSKIVGQSFDRYLTKQSLAKLKALLPELDRQPQGDPHLWIADGLQAMREGGEKFPAEATLAHFEVQKVPYYTLILRDVNERLQSEKRVRSLTEVTAYLAEEIKALHNFDEIIGRSKPMLNLLQDIQSVAVTDATVLIHGESGTGKELVARAIHSASQRQEKPLITVNCAAMPAMLVESELFGHEKGAFTGATGKRDGRFALADGGTIFLDEIGELPIELQAKLLRVLQEGEFDPVGSSQTRKVDVRVLAATNRDLHREVREARFREDLYYRLNVFPVEVPPLRKRGDDIALLASAFANKFARKFGKSIAPLSDSCLRRLQAYDWPGNVRELQNVIERAVITAVNGVLNIDRAISPTANGAAADDTSPAELPSGRILTARELQDIERNNIIRALESTAWRVAGKKGAAELLGLPHSTLSSRMKALGITRPRSQ